jgi:hypothetical protein
MKKRSAELDFIPWQKLQDAVQNQGKVDKKAVERLRAILDL